MSGPRYTEGFKRDAVAQITDRGHSVRSVADGLGVCTKSIYDWVKRYGSQEPERRTTDAGRAENRRLKAELARVTEERDIFKRGRRVLCQRVPVKYAFIKAHRRTFSVRSMCRVLKVHPSGL